MPLLFFTFCSRFAFPTTSVSQAYFNLRSDLISKKGFKTDYNGSNSSRTEIVVNFVTIEDANYGLTSGQPVSAHRLINFHPDGASFLMWMQRRHWR